MRISIQIALFNGWDKNPPAFHLVDNWQDAIDLAYIMSHQFANTTVRVCDCKEWAFTPDDVSRLSGTYIQSTELNTVEVVGWSTSLVQGRSVKIMEDIIKGNANVCAENVCYEANVTVSHLR